MKLKGRPEQVEPLCESLAGIIIVTLMQGPVSAEWDTCGAVHLILLLKHVVL